MKFSTPDSKINSQTPDKNNFNIVVLYDDLPAGKRAHEACTFLLDPSSDDGINYEMWNFGVLRIPEVKAQATRNAAEADLVVVATSQAKSFEPHVREWFNQWIETKSPERSGALLALCDSDSHISQKTFLQEIAERADFQFFTKAA